MGVAMAAGAGLTERFVTEGETRLTESHFDSPPDPSVFSIDGLGMPIGARIENQITGETYHYGVDAPGVATLDGIAWRASGPRNRTAWWRWAVLAIVALSGGAVLAYRRIFPALRA